MPLTAPNATHDGGTPLHHDDHHQGCAQAGGENDLLTWVFSPFSLTQYLHLWVGLHQLLM